MEPQKLSEAKAHLRQFEKLLKAQEGRHHLKAGVNLLVELAEGDYPQSIKDTTANLVVSYRNKVVSEVEGVLSNATSFDQDELWGWHCVMQEFVETSLDDGPFNACHTDLLACWFDRFWKSLSPWQQERLKNEFKKKAG